MQRTVNVSSFLLFAFLLLILTLYLIASTSRMVAESWKCRKEGGQGRQGRQGREGGGEGGREGHIQKYTRVPEVTNCASQDNWKVTDEPWEPAGRR